MALSTDQKTVSEKLLNTETMLRAEFGHVLADPRWTDPQSPPLAQLFQEMHAQPAERRPSALCLSGGGIRSATFCLGVLQWLAGQKQLKDFHYLSTVSGGGYIGSWLVNGLWQAGRPFVIEAEAQANRVINAAQARAEEANITAVRENTAVNVAVAAAATAALTQAKLDAEDLKRAAALQAAAATADWLHRVGNSAGSVGAASAAGAARTGGGPADPVAPLRAFSNYLSPTGGLSGDAFSLAAIFIRNLLLNALVWLPLLAAIVALPRLYISVLSWVPPAEWIPNVQWGIVGVALLAIVGGVAYIVADLPAPRDPPPVPTAPTPVARQAATVAAAGQKPLSDRFFGACFVPIVLAAIILSVGGAWVATLRDLPWWIFAFAGAIAHFTGVIFGVWLRIVRGNRRRNRSVVGVIAVVVVGAFGGALASVALSQLGVDLSAVDTTDSQRLLYASFAVPAMTGAFWLAMALYAGLMARFTDEQDREWWARATAAWLKFSLLWVVAFALIVWLPLLILDHLPSTGSTAVQFGVGGGLLGILTSMIGYWSKNGGNIKRKAQGFARITRLKLLDSMAALVVLTTLLALSLGWSAALDRCHGWSWTASLCATDLHAQTEFLREQTRLRAEYGSANKAAPNGGVDAAVDIEAPDNDKPGRSAAARVYRHVLLNADGRMLISAFAGLLIFAAFLAWTMGANHFSLHGMYGNRLVRAYLGSGRVQRHPHWFTGFDPDDNPKLAELSAPLSGPNGERRLYPVINIALNLVRPSPKHLDWQQRKAAPFIATPLHCGAANVGYRPTERYAGGMSLGRALTISGAAASPNMGYHSSTMVTFVMTLFNVRLGWWSPNPGPASGDCWDKDQPRLGLDVALAEARGSTGEDDPFIYLSDGGHFDNLGIYEMVRRRCRRIVAVDATCDGEFKWADLLEVVRKIRVDLGIPIELPAILPGRGLETSHARCVKACIRYSARDGNDRQHDGMLIVLKPRLMPQQDPPELAAYAAASAADGSPSDDPARFPHQSTADQFYDEQQFESYRLLGYLTAADTLGDLPPSLSVTENLVAVGARGDEQPDTTGPTGGVASVAGAGGIGHLFQQFGTGAALATALTVGGTLGVAGTVALAPSDLTLSLTDRALLKDGLSLRFDGSTFKLNDDDRQLLGNGMRITADGSALDNPATQLTAAANSLDAAAQRFSKLNFPPLPNITPGPPGGTTVVLDQSTLMAVNSLKNEISQLKERIRATSADGADLTSALTALRRTLDSIEQKPLTDPKLADALTQLKEAVERIAPRRNVRGQDGGGR